MIDLNSPINKLKMNFGLTPDLLRALQRTTQFANQYAASPQAAAAAQAPAPQVKQPGLFSGMGERSMPTPDGMKQAGLLSDDDIKAARRQGILSLGASLLANSGPKLAKDYVGPMAAIGQGVQSMQDAYKGAIDSSMNMRAGAQKFANEKVDAQGKQLDVEGKQIELARAKALPGQRQAIIQKYPMPNATDPGAMANWIDTVLPHFIEANDEDTVRSLSEVRKSIDSYTMKPKFDTLDTGGEMVDRIVMPDGTIKEIGRTKKTATPNTLMRGELMTPAARERAEGNIIGEFDRQTKDYVKAHEAWSQVQHVLDRARSNTHSPDDIVQLLDGISRLNNPGAIVRSGTVQLQMEKIGSAEQKLRMYLSQGAKGAWPTDVVEGIGRAAREIAKEHQKQFTDLRKRAIARGNRAGLDYMDSVLPNTWGEGVESSAPAFHAPMALPGGNIDPRLQGIPRAQ